MPAVPRLYCNYCNSSFTNWPDFYGHKINSWQDHHYCRGCEKDFHTFAQLDEHINLRHTCTWCKLSFYSPSHLEDHWQTEHAFCEKCKVPAKNNKQLNEHLRKKHHFCDLCEKECESSSLLLKHFRLEHGSDPSVSFATSAMTLGTQQQMESCELCDVPFYKPCHRWKHLYHIHRYCDLCMKSFDDETDLKNHYHTSRLHEICDQCKQPFQSAPDVVEHKVFAPNHHYCRSCDSLFDTESDFETHKTKIHYCQWCDMNFASALARKEHNLEMHYTCEVCKLIWKREDDAKKHFRNDQVHPNYCQLCEEDCRTADDLKRHKKDSHRHHYCSNCDIDFKTKPLYQEHRKETHRCNWCNLTFPTHSSRRAHNKKFHYGCQDCNQVWLTEAELKTHLRFSDKHHYCWTCDEQFTSINNLLNHINSSVHQQQTFPCPFSSCRVCFASMAAVISHVEAGKCISGIDRRTLNAIVSRLDNGHSFIVKCHSSGCVQGPSAASPPILTEDSLQKAWNGRTYECLLCHSGYRNISDLRQHLESQRHEAKIYGCPLSTCGANFSSLSALWQHVESRTCGVTKFKEFTGLLAGVMQKAVSLY